jgi:predicted nucleotidyltransferase
MERRVRDDIIAELAGQPVVGAFIYGSVARGTATANSDIDVFVLLGTELPPAQIALLRNAFFDLQRRLGYLPDPEYPVELFATDTVREALTADVPDEDQREVRRALVDTKIVLVRSAQLEEFIAMAGGRT